MQDGSSNFPCAMIFTVLNDWVQCFTFPVLVSDTTENCYHWSFLFNSRQKEIVLSPSRSSWIPHNKGGKRRKSFLQFCFSSQCLGNAFTSGCLFSWMENITSWTEKKKKSKMQAHVTVFLVYCGYRGRGTKKYHWKCALTLRKTTMGLLLIITEVSPYWKIQTKFSCVHTS